MFRLKSNCKTTKGMIFAGCSFTWGQGLYYYSNLPSLKEPQPHHYDADIVKFTHYEYMKTLRYPRLVANHFKTFDVCQPFNGGATYSIIDWWNKCFDSSDPNSERNKSLNGNWIFPKYDYSDFSHIIFQFTQWTRSHSPAIIVPNKKGIITRTSHGDSMTYETFSIWLRNNNMTMEQYIDNGLKQDLNDVKNFLKKFEDNGVKPYVLSWPFDMVPYIMNDPWLSQRFITFEYTGIKYDNIELMMGTVDREEVPHPELTIVRDTENFEVTPQDWHPSLACHRVIADSIIKHLEQNE